MGWLPTPERQAEIDAHWANVRAGLHKPEQHVFGDDRQGAIAAHRFRASLLIESAARHARIAIDLASLPEATEATQ